MAPGDAATTFEVTGSVPAVGLKVFEDESFGRARRLDHADGSVVTPGYVFPAKTGSTYVLGLRTGDAPQGTFALRWRPAEGSPVAAGGEPRAPERPGVRVAAGREHSLVVHGNGRVMGWGSSDSGPHRLDDALAEPRTVRGLEDVVEVAAGDGFVGGGLPARPFSLALGLDGQLRAWGSNQYGFLGVGMGSQRRPWHRVAARGGVHPAAPRARQRRGRHRRTVVGGVRGRQHRVREGPLGAPPGGARPATGSWGPATPRSSAGRSSFRGSTARSRWRSDGTTRSR